MEHAFREAIAGIRRAPLLTALSAGMVGLALFVVGVFGLAAHNLQEALSSLEERVEIVAYLEDDARQSEVTIAQDELRVRPEVTEVRLITKDQALRRAQDDLPEFRDVFANLDQNPLPASLEIRLAEEGRTEDVVEDIAHQAELYPFVEDVRFGEEWVQRLFLLRRIAGFTSMFLGIAFGVVAALIIGAAIRIAIFARRDEIAIMRLVGARNGFIRGPFLLEGAITGIVGGAFALLGTFVSYRAVSGFLFEMDWLPALWSMLVVLAGGALGMLASAFAVRRHLREI
jgi:cell division transport system permease protein